MTRLRQTIEDKKKKIVKQIETKMNDAIKALTRSHQ